MHDSRVFAYKEIIKASAPGARVLHLRLFRRWRLLLLAVARTCWRFAPCVALFPRRRRFSGKRSRLVSAYRCSLGGVLARGSV